MQKKKVTKKKKKVKKTLVERVAEAGTSQCHNNRRRNKGHLWVPPDDMDPEFADKVRNGKACGAKLKKGRQGYCHASPVAGQAEMGRFIPLRCRFHGGASQGAPKGNQRNLKHGFYSKALLKGEDTLYDGLKADGLDEEIRFTKIRLRRALIEEANQRTAAMAGDDAIRAEMELSEIEGHVEYDDEGNATDKSTRTTRKLRNAELMVHQVINQLTKLLQTKAQVEGHVGAFTPQEKAHMARDALAEARKDIP